MINFETAQDFCSWPTDLRNLVFGGGAALRKASKGKVDIPKILPNIQRGGEGSKF